MRTGKQTQVLQMVDFRGMERSGQLSSGLIGAGVVAYLGFLRGRSCSGQCSKNVPYCPIAPWVTLLYLVFKAGRQADTGVLSVSRIKVFDCV